MFYESDYIMRMIHLLRLLYEYLCGMTDAQQLKAGDDAIEEALRNLTGLSFDTADSLDAEQLAAMVGGEGASRVYALAELHKMRAELHERLGFPDEAYAMHLKAFLIYLQIERPGKEISDEMYPTLFNYKKMFFNDLSAHQLFKLGTLFERAGFYADAEDSFFAGEEEWFASGGYASGEAIAFYRRLLRYPDLELEKGGLTRREVQEGLRLASEGAGERGTGNGEQGNAGTGERGNGGTRERGTRERPPAATF